MISFFGGILGGILTCYLAIRIFKLEDYVIPQWEKIAEIFKIKLKTKYIVYEKKSILSIIGVDLLLVLVYLIGYYLFYFLVSFLLAIFLVLIIIFLVFYFVGRR